MIGLVAVSRRRLAASGDQLINISALLSNTLPNVVHPERRVIASTLIRGYNTEAEDSDAGNVSTSYSSYQSPLYEVPGYNFAFPTKWRRQQRPPMKEMLEYLQTPNPNPAKAQEAFNQHIRLALHDADLHRSGIPYHMQPPIEAWKLSFMCMMAMNATPRAMLENARKMTDEFGMPPQLLAFTNIIRRASRFRDVYTVKAVMKKVDLYRMRINFPLVGYAIETAIRANDTDLLMDLLHRLPELDYNTQQQERKRDNLIIQASRILSKQGKYRECFRLLAIAQETAIHKQLCILKDVTHWAALEGRHDVLADSIEGLLMLHQSNTLGERSFRLKEEVMAAVLRIAESTDDWKLADSTWELMKHHLAITEQQQKTSSPVARKKASLIAELESSSSSSSSDDDSDSSSSDSDQEEGHYNVGDMSEEEYSDEEGDSTASGQNRKRLTIRHVVPSVLSYRIYLNTVASSGRIPLLLDTLMEMVETHKKSALKLVKPRRMPKILDAFASDVRTLDTAYYQLEQLQKQHKNIDMCVFNLIIAACCQIGDLARAFQTYEHLEALGVAPDADTFNVLLAGCVAANNQGAFDAVLKAMGDAGLPKDKNTMHLLVEQQVVKGDIQAMLTALNELDTAGVNPESWLLEKCVSRCEHDGDVENLEPLLHRLKRSTGSSGWRQSVAASKERDRRWASVEGGARLVTGSDRFVSRNSIKMTPYYEKKKERASSS